MSKNALMIDYEFCSGCHSCEIICKNHLGLPTGQWGIKVLEDGPRKLADGSWHWDYIALPTELCDLCEDRTSAGEVPLCVQSCQAKVMYYGTPEELAKKMVEMGPKTVIFQP